MLTTVILEGPMGKEFGREWKLDIESPREALCMIDANMPGVFRWIRNNLKKYERYQVVCEYENGQSEALSSAEYTGRHLAKVIRFIPVVEGAGGNGGIIQTILGAVLVVVGVWNSNPQLTAAGLSLMLGGIISMLSPHPSKPDIEKDEATNGLASYYFDGPTNTTGQGSPVQLIYGRTLVGSHTISVSATIDQLM